MMAKCKIYCGIFPISEIEATKEEAKKYLTCKFFKTSKSEAQLFANFYLGCVPTHESLHRVIGIISGDFNDGKNIEEKFNEINEAVRQSYVSDCSDLVKNKKYAAIVSVIRSGDSYPKCHTLIDIISWSFGQKLINSVEEKLLRSNFEKTCLPIFNETADTNLKLSLINQFLSRHCNYILYSDAKELLFPELNLLSELKEAIKKGELVDNYSSLDDKIYYFNFRPLLKWLMNKGHVSQLIEDKFDKIKIESIKENLLNYRGPLYSLAKLIQHGNDKNDLLTDVLNGKSDIYLKYPRDYLQWRRKSTTIQSSKNHFEMTSQRYDGLGQLKKIKTDDTYQCQFGGLTVDMLMYNEYPRHGLSEQIPSIDYEVELTPTTEEVRYGLQPYLKVPSSEIRKIVTDENLVILANVITPKVPSSKPKQTRAHALNDLIKEIYESAEDKKAVAIWKKLKILAEEGHEIVQEVASWTAPNAKVSWVTHRGKERTKGRRTFENDISNLENSYEK